MRPFILAVQQAPANDQVSEMDDVVDMLQRQTAAVAPTFYYIYTSTARNNIVNDTALHISVYVQSDDSAHEGAVGVI